MRILGAGAWLSQYWKNKDSEEESTKSVQAINQQAGECNIMSGSAKRFHHSDGAAGKNEIG